MRMYTKTDFETKDSYLEWDSLEQKNCKGWFLIRWSTGLKNLVRLLSEV